MMSRLYSGTGTRTKPHETSSTYPPLSLVPPWRERPPFDQDAELDEVSPALRDDYLPTWVDVRKRTPRLLGAILAGYLALTGVEKAVELGVRNVASVARYVVSSTVDRFDGIECSGATVDYQVPPGGSMGAIALMVDPSEKLNWNELLDQIEAVSGHGPNLVAGERLTVPAPNSCNT